MIKSSVTEKRRHQSQALKEGEKIKKGGNLLKVFEEGESLLIKERQYFEYSRSGTREFAESRFITKATVAVAPCWLQETSYSPYKRKL